MSDEIRTITEKPNAFQRAERHAGGGIWITEKQIAWTAGAIAAFSLALAGFAALPSFVTTKEQGANTASDVANLQQLYLTNRTADIQVQNQLVTSVATVAAQQKVTNDKLDEFLKENKTLFKTITEEQQVSREVRAKLRADIDYLFNLNNTKNTN